MKLRGSADFRRIVGRRVTVDRRFSFPRVNLDHVADFQHIAEIFDPSAENPQYTVAENGAFERSSPVVTIEPYLQAAEQSDVVRVEHHLRNPKSMLF